MSIDVRVLRSDDWPEVARIFGEGIQTGNATFETEVPSWEEWDREHLAGNRLVAEDGGEVVGFGSLSPYRDRPAYSTSVGDSVYVRRDRQGEGIGKALLAELLRLATAHGFHTVMARIVGGHEASIALHRAAGFGLVGTEREIGRKFGQWLDVVVMQVLL